MIGLPLTQRIVLPKLAKYVKGIDYYDCSGFVEVGQTIVVNLHAEGVFEIIFQLHSPVWQQQNESGWRVRHDAFIGGLFKGGYQIKVTTATRLLCIRFQLGTAKYFIPGCLNAFTGQLIPYSEIWKDHLSERLAEITNLKDQLQLIEKALSKWFIADRRSAIDQALEQIIQSQGVVDIALLAKGATLSEVQFRRRFREEVGLSPKYFARITRVNAIADILKARTYISLTHLSYRFAYFDQAHFIKDLKSVTGFSPSQYQRGG